MKSILDPSFRYTSSSQTDIAKTFERIRRELQRDPGRGALRSEDTKRLAHRPA